MVDRATQTKKQAAGDIPELFVHYQAIHVYRVHKTEQGTSKGICKLNNPKAPTTQDTEISMRTAQPQAFN